MSKCPMYVMDITSNALTTTIPGPMVSTPIPSHTVKEPIITTKVPQCQQFAPERVSL